MENEKTLLELYLDALKAVMIYVELVCKGKKAQITNGDELIITDWLMGQVTDKNEKLLERQVTRFIKGKRIGSVSARNKILEILLEWTRAKPEGAW